MSYTQFWPPGGGGRRKLFNKLFLSLLKSDFFIHLLDIRTSKYALFFWPFLIIPSSNPTPLVPINYNPSPPIPSRNYGEGRRRSPLFPPPFFPFMPFRIYRPTLNYPHKIKQRRRRKMPSDNYEGKNKCVPQNASLSFCGTLSIFREF